MSWQVDKKKSSNKALCFPYVNITVLAIFRHPHSTMPHNFCAKDSVWTKWFDSSSISIQERRSEVEFALWIHRLKWGFLIEKGLLNCGKTLVSISLLFFRGEKFFFVVGCVGKRWVLAPLKSYIKYFAPYVGAQTLAIFSLMYQHTDEAHSILPFY